MQITHRAFGAKMTSKYRSQYDVSRRIDVNTGNHVIVTVTMQKRKTFKDSIKILSTGTDRFKRILQI